MYKLLKDLSVIEDHQVEAVYIKITAKSGKKVAWKEACTGLLILHQDLLVIISKIQSVDNVDNSQNGS